MLEQKRFPPLIASQTQPDQDTPSLPGKVRVPKVCPICGAMVEARPMGKEKGWVCLVGGYAHYYQARYGYLERWFTSGEGNLREPLIRAMNCAA
jgi:hypothetical protein